MMKRTVFFMALLLAAVYLQAMAPAKKKDFIGEWKFDVSNAPYGYQQGTIFIVEKEGALTGEIKFADGEKIKMEKMAVTNGVLTFQIYVQSSYVNGKASIEENKFKGTAMTPEGDIPFEATKVAKKN